MSVIIDVYHPLVPDDHDEACASLCTNNAGHPGPCATKHDCWCPDGSMNYHAFSQKHPDITVPDA